MTNDIILQRYVEVESQLRRVMTVIRHRSRAHSHDLRDYEITERGLVVNGPLTGYQGIISGVPQRRSMPASDQPGRSDRPGRRASGSRGGTRRDAKDR